jgi:asparagine synthase (glutamine-hydrolysing)
MCGICGFIDFRSNTDVVVLNKMVSTLHHRGPDDRGGEVFNYSGFNVGLGHTRLSILDLSSAGHQPMHFEYLSVVFNGEIYNFKEIKNELCKLGHRFRSESDTEVILHAFMEWGNSSVNKFNGMFVIVIFNKSTFELTIIRDRAGVKPLFYYWKNGLFLFASELKAFHQHPHFEKEINENAVHQYMDFGYIPSPYCIFENCKKLNPGHILSFRTSKKSFETTKYWDVNDYYRLTKVETPYEEAKGELEKLLLSAFEYRMVADVPVGVFLSGGYDSTAVAAMLQSSRTEKLKTFTIGFKEGNNEAPYGKEIANYIGTDHNEYYCTSKEAQEIITTLPFFYDEPFADSSAIPTMLVSRFAKENVNVALSADAGDEIFAGYSTYKSYLDDLARVNLIPRNFKKEVGNVLNLTKHTIPKGFLLRRKMSVLSSVLKAENGKMQQELLKNYPYVKINNDIKNSLFINTTEERSTSYNNDFNDFNDDLSIALSIDYSMYLQNDILTKVDRATMSASLEGREPFLDHRILEYAAQLPNDYKFGTSPKMILKDIVHKYVPRELLDRPKAGFSLPINSWLKGDLSPLLYDNLNKNMIKETGIFNASYVDKLVGKFLKGKLYDEDIIWRLIQFQMWYKEWM